MRTFKYMVVYQMKSLEGSGVGRMFITRTGKIVTQEDVEGVDAYLKEQNPHFTTAFVTSFDLLK